MPDRNQQRAFAVDIVRQLRERGFEALWAGGCVRDRLLGLEPKDYDVATSATPDEVRDAFGRKRTLAVGASFGVITVLGTKQQGQIEVATFRRDEAYSDGRHPDRVEFTNAEEDARRRDFTINGLFYDPLEDRVIDYVGGQTDLAQRVVRAIGKADDRIAEDKLRMLRAVRMAATFGFRLDDATLAAIQRMAQQLLVVSAERIAAEMKRMLVHPSRVDALRLLRQAGLLPVVLPEFQSAEPAWDVTIRVLTALQDPSFPLALAAVLHAMDTTSMALAARWRLSNEETRQAAWLVEHAGALDEARRMPWPRLQRLLVHPFGLDLVALHTARVAAGTCAAVEIEYCRQRLALPPEELDPPPLVTGDDLVRHGMPPGKVFKALLETLRDAQLEGRISTTEQALALADHLMDGGFAGKDS